MGFESCDAEAEAYGRLLRAPTPTIAAITGRRDSGTSLTSDAIAHSSGGGNGKGNNVGNGGGDGSPNGKTDKYG